MAQIHDADKTRNLAAPAWLTALVAALLLAVIATFLLAAPARMASVDNSADLTMQSAAAATLPADQPPA
jgi:hypothetical protein